MDEQLVSNETSKLAKDKGFDLKSLFIYYSDNRPDAGKLSKQSFKGNWNNYGDMYNSAPTQSLLQRWLREKHNTHIIIEPSLDSITNSVYYRWRGRLKMNPANIGDISDTYEEALENALQQALKLI